jgi:uncharacterized membrane protein YcaP (DUF421 family)
LITEAILLIITIVLWDYFLDFLGNKFNFFERILAPRELLLIENGKLLRKNMQQELISYEELVSQLRQQGIEEMGEVKKCYLESNGHFSVLKKEEKADDKPKGNISSATGVN